MPESPLVIVTDRKLEPAELKRLVQSHFGDMVKYVVDVRRRVVAVGGDVHADAESLLIEGGSKQSDIWGANYYPGRGPDQCIEYTALINIRPAQGNRGMEVQDPTIREQVRDLTFVLLGRGEAL